MEAYYNTLILILKLSHNTLGLHVHYTLARNGAVCDFTLTVTVLPKKRGEMESLVRPELITKVTTCLVSKCLTLLAVSRSGRVCGERTTPIVDLNLGKSVQSVCFFGVQYIKG